jgi:long-chain acyl-CoA synthetase
LVGGENLSGQLTIPGMLRKSTRRFPDRLAMRSWSDQDLPTLTYTQLSAEVESFAAGLVALGLRAGDKVAICAENGPKWGIAYLSVVTAGGVGVPIYIESDARDIIYLTKEADARFAILSSKALAKVGRQLHRMEAVIVTDRASYESGVGRDWRAFLHRHQTAILSFQEVGARANEESRKTLADIVVQPDDLASLVYTSGTAGDPKGVMLSHRNIVFDAIAAVALVPITYHDTLLLVLPLHHSFPFTVGLILPLSLGAAVAFENDLRRIRDRLADAHVTFFIGVPALFSMMYRSIVSRIETEGKLAAFQKGLRIVDTVKKRTGINIGPIVFRSLHQRLGGKLRLMASGGAALPPDIASKFEQLGLMLIQGWGLTEASPVVSGQQISTQEFLLSRKYSRQVGSVGKALPGVDVRLIDVPDKGIYVHLQGQGELVVRGQNVTRGYYNNDDATREAIIGEWLHTGDIGRIDPDGNIYITGRAKYVIVLPSGDKVYPDEVEEKLAESPLVSDVCVVGRHVKKFLRGERTDVAAIIYPNVEAIQDLARRNNQSITADNVLAWITEDIEASQSTQPAFKRVSEIIITDEPLPKTPLRKIRRGMISDNYAFDVARFLESAPQI